MQSDDQCCEESVSANSLGVSVGEGRELITTARKPFFWGSQRFFGGTAVRRRTDEPYFDGVASALFFLRGATETGMRGTTRSPWAALSQYRQSSEKKCSRFQSRVTGHCSANRRW